jgi:putative endonuclease
MGRNQRIGNLGESLAQSYLRRAGFEIVAVNWHSRWGELDLVAREKGQWVFVEVKARTNNRFGQPEDSLTWKKKQRLIKTAWAFMSQHKLVDDAWRFDVLALQISPQGQLLNLEHYRNAFGAESDWL